MISQVRVSFDADVYLNAWNYLFTFQGEFFPERLQENGYHWFVDETLMNVNDQMSCLLVVY